MALRLTSQAMPAPCHRGGGPVPSVCGGVWRDYASAGGVDQILPVDVYIPGDPAHRSIISACCGRWIGRAKRFASAFSLSRRQGYPARGWVTCPLERLRLPLSPAIGDVPRRRSGQGLRGLASALLWVVLVLAGGACL